VNDVLTLILAGGKGTRLDPLTRERAKPAVPFGGLYRIIDFTLSNCINSNLRRILVLTQYKARSLDRHIAMGWSFLHRELDEYVDVVPPQQRTGTHWYEGTANAIYQNVYSIEKANPKDVLILAGDHIYKMDYRPMIAFHRERKADLTIGCIPVPRKEGIHFGIMDVDAQDRVVYFVEKPADPPPMPADPDSALASMGIYVFSARAMYEALFADAAREDSPHDFGKNIIPAVLETGRVCAYPFRDRNGKDIPYWRDVGTLDAFYQASMDLVAVSPVLNLYDFDWPVRTHQPQLPPPKFVFSEDGTRGLVRRGEAHDSMVCQGTVVSGGHVRRSILSPSVRVNSFSLLEDSILFEGVEVGRHCRIKRAIVDKFVKIPAGVSLGYDLDHDRRRGFTVTEGGIVVVPKGESEESFRRR
jgi:glucose-1-phosphate adenylyltransferase